MVGPEEVGSKGCCRAVFVGVGAWMVERAGQPDCSTSSFCSGLSWRTNPSAVVWRNSTMPGYSSGSLSVQRVSTTILQKYRGTDLDEGELATGTF